MADQRLRELFTDFAKKQSNLAGHNQTFDALGVSYERMIQRDLMKFMRDQGVALFSKVTKPRFQVLFKRYSTLGTHADYDQFLLIARQLASPGKE